MKRFVWIFLALFTCACAPQKTVTVTLPDGFEVSAQLAVTPKEHEKGLMFVTELPENKGMLFVFDTEDELLFWMKNTLIDLDMVFIGADKTVTSVANEMPHSYTYTPDNEIAYASGYGQYVLELSAKTAEKHGVKAGAKLQFTTEFQ